MGMFLGQKISHGKYIKFFLPALPIYLWNFLVLNCYLGPYLNALTHITKWLWSLKSVQERTGKRESVQVSRFKKSKKTSLNSFPSNVPILYAQEYTKKPKVFWHFQGI